jgi:HSP20 family molecular chaperone IbpA
MPGVDKSGLEITVDNGELTIVRHRRTEGNSGEPVYREIRHKEDFSEETAKIFLICFP